jgi:predicted GNAT family acetyltransferase
MSESQQWTRFLREEARRLAGGHRLSVDALEQALDAARDARVTIHERCVREAVRVKDHVPRHAEIDQ